MPKLTKLERDMLSRAAEFALAGEWPWEGGLSKEEARKEQREQTALRSAVTKLKAPLAEK